MLVIMDCPVSNSGPVPAAIPMLEPAPSMNPYPMSLNRSRSRRPHISVTLLSCLLALAGILSGGSGHAAAQTPGAPAAQATSGSGLGDGPIAPGDQVEVQVFDAPELSVHAEVSQSGDIPVPLLNVFHIAGMTSTEAASALADEFRKKQYVVDPRVLVTVHQFSAGVTVRGEVRTPGIYPLIGKRNLAQVLTQAGGTTERAGHVVHIDSGDPKQPSRAVAWDPTYRENSGEEVPLKSGDTVTVTRCALVYLGGNIAKPGGYPICDTAHASLAQLIDQAGGLKPFTSAKSILVRNDNGTRIVMNLNVNDIVKAQAPDIALRGDDIVYMPVSNWKAGARRMLEVAIAFASTSAVYLHP